MTPPPLRHAPYLDWSLDRWKIGLVLVLFTGLVVASAVEDGSRLPAGSGPDGQTAVAVDAGGVANSAGGLVALPTPEAADAATGDPDLGETLQFPLTLANLGPNAIVPDGTVRVLFGTAAAQSIVEVYAQVLPHVGGVPNSNLGLSPGSAVDVLLGVTTADSDGLWQLEPPAPLEPGQYVITLHQLNDQGQITAVSAPVVVTVLAGGEQGPLSLATPSIRYPFVGTQLAPGPVTFLGTGLPGVIIRLYVGSRLAAEGTVTTREEWRLTTEEALTPGVYVARVLALNPQGDVIAESAPVVFVVTEAARTGQSWRPAEPLLPLRVVELAYSDPTRSVLLMSGMATPHASVTVWADGQPLKVTNAQIDGSWQMSVAAKGVSDAPLEVRSSFGERLRTDTQPGLVQVRAAPVTPVLLLPQAGQVLTTRRPVVAGLAQPAGDVVVVVNGRVVAEVRSDAQGQWAYQLVEPLPSGATSLNAGMRDAARQVQLANPVLVTVAPRL